MSTKNYSFYNNDIKLTQLGGPKEWEKTESGQPNWKINTKLIFCIEGDILKKISKKEPIFITINKGFISEGGSFSSMIVPLIHASQTGKYFRAFILHDALCRTKHFTFSEANLILDEALKELGMGYWSRNKIYYALKFAGSATKKKELLNNANKYVMLDNKLG